MTITDNVIVITLWWIALGLTAFLIVPLALHLLHRTWRAARMIQRYTAETLEAGLGIASHTAAIRALDETIAAAGPVVEKAARLEAATAKLEKMLLDRVR